MRIQQLTLLVFAAIFLTLCPRFGMAQGAGANAVTPAPKAVKKIATHRRARRTSAGGPRRNPNAPVSLWVVSKPPNSKVFADDELKGETNVEGELELKLTPGTHRIRVSRDGYVTSEGEVEVTAASEATEVEFALAQAV